MIFLNKTLVISAFLLLAIYGTKQNLFAQINSESLYNQGLTALQSDDLKEAELKFRQAVVLDSGNKDAVRQLFEVLIDIGDWSGAMELVRRADIDATVAAEYYSDLSRTADIFEVVDFITVSLYPLSRGETGDKFEPTTALRLAESLIHTDIPNSMLGRLHFWFAEATKLKEGFDEEDAYVAYRSYGLAAKYLTGKTLGRIAVRKQAGLSYAAEYGRRATGFTKPFTSWGIAVSTDLQWLTSTGPYFERKTTKLSAAIIDYGLEVRATLFGKGTGLVSKSFTWEILGYYSYFSGVGDIYVEDNLGLPQFSEEYSWQSYEGGLMFSFFKVLNLGYGYIVYDTVFDVSGFSALFEFAPFYPLRGSLEAPRLAAWGSIGTRFIHGLNAERAVEIPIQEGFSFPFKIGLRYWF